MMRSRGLAVLVVPLLSLKSNLAYAYLDPGSVSLILQALFAAVAGGILTAKYWYFRVLRFFGLDKEDKKTRNNDPAS